MVIDSSALRGLRVSYSAVFNKAFIETTTNKDKIATTVPSSNSMNTYGWMGDFPQMREWIGERVINHLKEKAYNIENQHFEMTVAVSRDDIEDDNLGLYSIQMQMMGQAAKEHPDIMVMGQLKNGFKQKCYDDQPFFHTMHKVDKYVYKNRSDAKLCAESYAEARAAMGSITNERGTSINIRPSLLVVPPVLEKEARLILEADFLSGTSNPWKGSAELLVDNNIAGGEHPNNWFLLDVTKPLKPIIFQLRKPTKFISLVNENDSNVFTHNEYVYGADGRYATGYGFWQMAFGSTGEKEIAG